MVLAEYGGLARVCAVGARCSSPEAPKWQDLWLHFGVDEHFTRGFLGFYIFDNHSPIFSGPMFSQGTVNPGHSQRLEAKSYKRMQKVSVRRDAQRVLRVTGKGSQFREAN